MPVIFDMGRVLKYYMYMKAKGEVKRGLQEAMANFKIEEAIEKIEKKVKGGEVFVVPCITGKQDVVEIEGEKFVEVC